jgi:hypothetical protein
MGARDRYTSNVECPKCKQKGVLHIAEDEYRYSPLRREIEREHVGNPVFSSVI